MNRTQILGGETRFNPEPDASTNYLILRYSEMWLGRGTEGDRNFRAPVATSRIQAPYGNMLGDCDLMT